MISRSNKTDQAAKHRVLVTSYYDPQVTDPALARLKPLAEIDRVYCGRRLRREEIIDHFADANVAVISDEEIDGGVLKLAPQLWMICADGVGAENVDLAAATSTGVIVNNAPFVHEANGDFTMGLILALTRRIVTADRGVRAGHWSARMRYLGCGLGGRTLGLVGFGRAAKAVAKRARGFGLKLLAHCRRPCPEAEEGQGVEFVGLAELLRRSDIVSLHVPLTELTRGMIGPDQFAQMKRSAYLINTSRGLVVDEAALIEALQSGKLAGAALDVFTQEPPPADHPLLKMDNVVVTPHIASDTGETFRAVFEGVVDDILRLLKGQRPGHIVNPAVLAHPRLQHLKEAQ